MSENTPTLPTGGTAPEIGSDLAKVDAHVITAAEYDEISELTDAWFDRADFRTGGKLLGEGRPPTPDAK